MFFIAVLLEGSEALYEADKQTEYTDGDFQYPCRNLRGKAVADYRTCCNAYSHRGKQDEIYVAMYQVAGRTSHGCGKLERHA